MAFGVTTPDLGMNTAVGILSARVTGYKSGLTTEGGQVTTLGINSFRYDLFLPAAQGIDNKILNDTDGINTQQQQLVSLGGTGTFSGAPIGYGDTATAVAAVNDLYGNTTSSQDGFVRINFGSSHTFTAGENVTQEGGGIGVIGFTTTGNYVIMSGVTSSIGTGASCSVGPGVAYSDNTDIGEPTSVDVVGYGMVHGDMSIIRYYPDLEPVNTDISSPFTNVQYNRLTTANDGLGAGNTYFNNGVDSGRGGTPVFGSATSYGRVWAFSTTANAPSVAAATSIYTISDEIGVTRIGLGSDTDSQNVIKNLKNGYAINVWTFEKNIGVAQSSITALNNAIGILTDPAYGGPF